MPPLAYVVHRTRRRVRLRVPEKREEPEWFGHAAAALEQLDWVSDVKPAARSTSLVIVCATGDCSDERLSQTGIFTYQAQPMTVAGAAEQLKSGLARIDRALRDGASDGTNLRSLLLLAMLVLTGVQISRGKIMVPAISLLWYAMELILGAGQRPRPDGTAPAVQSTDP